MLPLLPILVVAYCRNFLFLSNYLLNMNSIYLTCCFFKVMNFFRFIFIIDFLSFIKSKLIYFWLVWILAISRDLFPLIIVDGFSKILHQFISNRDLIMVIGIIYLASEHLLSSLRWKSPRFRSPSVELIQQLKKLHLIYSFFFGKQVNRSEG